MLTKILDYIKKYVKLRKRRDNMGLKEHRLKMNFTQEELARLLNIPLRTYQNIEKRNDTTVKIAKNIAVIFGCSIEEIFRRIIKKLDII